MRACATPRRIRPVPADLMRFWVEVAGASYQVNGVTAGGQSFGATFSPRLWRWIDRALPAQARRPDQFCVRLNDELGALRIDGICDSDAAHWLARLLAARAQDEAGSVTLKKAGMGDVLVDNGYGGAAAGDNEGPAAV